ncbi:hypothetical protein AeRB84_004149 [Aphanomyces euteiches]|nr:hypothetical protein AeRB84_004149 [Aphanomyces euteiches]
MRAAVAIELLIEVVVSRAMELETANVLVTIRLEAFNDRCELRGPLGLCARGDVETKANRGPGVEQLLVESRDCDGAGLDIGSGSTEDTLSHLRVHKYHGFPWELLEPSLRIRVPERGELGIQIRGCSSVCGSTGRVTEEVGKVTHLVNRTTLHGHGEEMEASLFLPQVTSIAIAVLADDKAMSFMITPVAVPLCKSTTLETKPPFAKYALEKRMKELARTAGPSF